VGNLAIFCTPVRTSGGHIRLGTFADLP